MLKPQIGEVAGKIWEVLGRDGAQTPAALGQSLKVSTDLAHQGLGWLARENKIELQQKPKPKVGLQTIVSLTPLEQDVYRTIKANK